MNLIGNNMFAIKKFTILKNDCELLLLKNSMKNQTTIGIKKFKELVETNFRYMEKFPTIFFSLNTYHLFKKQLNVTPKIKDVDTNKSVLIPILTLAKILY
jgi:hypothetical protein